MRSVLRRLLLVAAGTVLVTFSAGGDAQAHPFGDPQTVKIGLADGNDGEVVQVQWQVGMTDDLSWLALHLGLLPDDRVMLDGAMWYEDGDGDLLADAAEFDTYLLEHIVVSSDGETCTGTVASKDDPGTEGATLRFDCSGPVNTAEIKVSMLTDLHPAYKTMATGPGGQRFVYDGESPSQDWTFDPTGSGSTGSGSSAALQLGGVVGGLALVAIAIGLTQHRRRTGSQA